jgi:hypothetical protein
MFLQQLKAFLPNPKDDGDEAHINLKLTSRVLTLWILGSLFSVLMWCAAFRPGGGILPDFAKTVSAFGQASIVAAGAFAVGTFFGFLFGIPKTLQDQSGTATSDSGPLQATNTNLEQISDWLTKILVGVGLTQLYSLRGQLKALGSYFAVASSPALTLSMLLNFSIAGFLSGYLLTRLFLTGAFVAVERSLRELTSRAQKLQEERNFGAALTRYESALQKIGPDTTPEQRREIYEGLIFNSLYEESPAGFQKSLEYGDLYQRDTKAAPSAKVHAYLAAAYGQQYVYERNKKNASAETLAEIRSRCLNEIRQALEISPGARDLLRMMWDPSYPSKSPGDDDLEVFFDDQEFKAILGGETDPAKRDGDRRPETQG